MYLLIKPMKTIDIFFSPTVKSRNVAVKTASRLVFGFFELVRSFEIATFSDNFYKKLFALKVEGKD